MSYGPASVGRRRAMSSNADKTTGKSLADRFSTLWENGGPSPDVFAFLDVHLDAGQRERLDVLLVDQRFRWRTGSVLAVECYLRAIPDAANDAGFADELRRQEHRLQLELIETLPDIA